jgi:hypothetical protein
MPTTKPVGAYQVAVIAESPAMAATGINLTSAFLRVLGSEIGEGGREISFVPVARKDRGRFLEVDGRYKDVSWKLDLPLIGSGTAGTALVPRGALWTDASGMSVVDGGSDVVYEADDLNPAGSVSIMRVDQRAFVSDYLAGCIAAQVALEFSKDGPPKLSFSGTAARKAQMCKSTLGVAIVAADAVAMTLADLTCITDGSNSAAITGLKILAKIDTEIIMITGYTPATGVCVIARGQLGSTGATHLSAAPVTPMNSDKDGLIPTYNEDDGKLIGAHDWSVKLNTVAIKCTKATITINTGRKFDPLSSGESQSTGINNGALEVTASLEMIMDTTRFKVFQMGDKRVDCAIEIIAGSTAGSIFTIALDKCRIKTVTPPNLAANEIGNVTVAFDCFDTLGAMLGQFKLTET